MWKLLSETRSKCLYAWMIGGSIITFFVLIQSFTGKLVAEDLPFAWTWVAVNLLPGLFLLGFQVLRLRLPAKLIHPVAHQALVWGAWGYMFMLLLTFFSLGMALGQGNSVIGYFRNSWYWLLPAQGLLLLGFWLAFFKKESVFRPGEQVITALAQQKASEAQKKGNVQRQQCYEWVADNNMDAVFNCLKQAYEGKNAQNLNAAIALEAQYRELRRQVDLQLVDPKEAQFSLNRITMGVLNLIEAL